MVIRYRFPYSRQREAELLGAHKLMPIDRVPYYQVLSAAVERNLLFTEYLRQESVPSILEFENTYQKQEDNGIIAIYGVLTEPVTPITQAIFQKDFNALTALEVFLRLSHILRDIHKTPISPILKYLDMDDVYLTQDNKIRLGGFFYVDGDGLPPAPGFLPDAPIVAPLPPATTGYGQEYDIKILARIAWNVFSGLPWDCSHLPVTQRIPPKYAPVQLLEILESGLNAESGSENIFRRQLMQCRKDLSKTDFATLTIPACNPMRKEYHFRTDREAATAPVTGGFVTPK